MRAATQRLDQRWRYVFGRDDHKAALAGKVERLKSQHAADAAHRGIHGDVGGVQRDANVALGGNLVQYGAHAAACGVSNDVHVAGDIQHGLDARPERCAVAGDVGFDAKVIARKQDGAAMTSHVTCHDDGVSGLGLGARGCRAVYNLANACGGDEHAINLAATGHLGVARNQCHARLLGGCGHRIGNEPQVIEGIAFLDDKGTREVTRTSTHAGQVVNRAAYRELADVAAREERRRHDEAVRGHGDSSCGTIKHRGVICREERA